MSIYNRQLPDLPVCCPVRTVASYLLICNGLIKAFLSKYGTRCKCSCIYSLCSWPHSPREERKEGIWTSNQKEGGYKFIICTQCMMSVDLQWCFNIFYKVASLIRKWPTLSSRARAELALPLSSAANLFTAGWALLAVRAVTVLSHRPQ